MSFGKNRIDAIDADFEEVSTNEEEVSAKRIAFVRREQKVRSQFWDKLKRVAGKLPFADDLVAAYYCAMDVNTPLKVRATLLGALAYFILPFDLVPDFLAGVGFGDDAAVLAAAISLVSAHITPNHRAAAAKALQKTPPEEDDIPDA